MTDFIVGFIMGLVVVFLILTFYFNVERKESKNDSDVLEEYTYYFYVILPGKSTPIEIYIDEPLDLNHQICLDDVWYKVIEIRHINKGETHYVLDNDNKKSH